MFSTGLVENRKDNGPICTHNNLQKKNEITTKNNGHISFISRKLKI